MGQVPRSVQQNRESRNQFTQMWSFNLWKRYKSNSMKKEHSFQQIANNWSPTGKKINLDLNLTLYANMNSKWIIDLNIKHGIIGLPWWCSGWESACQCRGHGFEPWSGRMPRAAEQLGLWATLLSLRVWSLCSATREAAMVRGPCTAMRSGPRLPQLEKALAQKRRPSTTKINK